MRGVPSTRKPTASEIAQQTKEMFDNVGLDIPPNEVKSDEQAAELTKHLVSMIQSSSEWDDIIAAETQAMSFINGGALKFDSFKKGIPDLYLGLTYGATNSRSALVKTSCLLISLLARELGSDFDTMGDYITPLSKQLANGTQFIADCAKNTILTISKFCPGRKTFQNILSFCSSKGSQQKLVASMCLNNIMQNWPAESLGTNWPRFYNCLAKFLEDASPFVRQYARKTARSIKTCSKQRSVEFFSRLDSKMKKKILEENDDGVYKPRTQTKQTPVKIVTEDPIEKPQKPPKVIKTQRPPQKQDFSPRREPVERRRVSALAPKAPRSQQERPHSSIPVRSKKPEPPQPVEKQPQDNVLLDDDSEPEITPFEFNKPSQRNFYRLAAGKEMEYVTRIRDVIDRGATSEIINSMKDVSKDLVRCMLCDDSKLCVSSLAAVHDLIQIFPDNFDPHCTTIIHRCLQLCSSSNDPRVVSNAKIILDSVPPLMNCKTIISSCEKENPSLFLLSLILSCISNEKCNPFLTDVVVRTTALSIAVDSCDLSGDRSMELSRQVFKVIFEKCGPSALTEFEAKIYCDKRRLSSFKKICENDTQNILTAVDTSVNEYKSQITDLTSYKNNFKDWCKAMEDFCNQFDNETWSTITSAFCLSKISDVISTNIQKTDIHPALFLIQRLLSSRGTSSYSSFLYAVMLCKSDEKYRRTCENILSSIEFGVKTIHLLSSLQPLIRESNKIVSNNSIVYQRKVIRSTTALEFKEISSDVVCSLCDIIDFEVDCDRSRRVLCAEALADIALLEGQCFYKETRYISLAQTSKGLVEIAIASRKT